MHLKFVLRTTLIAAMVLPGSIAAAQTATIKISYTFVYDRIRPEPQRNVRVTINSDIALSQGGAVREKISRNAGPFSDQYKQGTKLGDGQWDVISNDQLRRTFDQPQSTLVLTVTTRDNTCALDVQFALKPGFQDYKFRRITDGTIAFFTQPDVVATRCSIQD